MPEQLVREIAEHSKAGSIAVSRHETKFGTQVHVQPAHGARGDPNEILLYLKKNAVRLKLDASNKSAGTKPQLILSQGNGGRNWKAFVSELEKRKLV